MTEENRQRALEMFSMRLDGCSYAEIAEKYGITRQRVEQILAHREPAKQGRKSTFEYVVYPGLKKWLIENDMTLIALHRLITRDDTRNPQRTKSKLKGEVKFNINDINKIIAVSGLTYEELFQKKEEESGC